MKRAAIFLLTGLFISSADCFARPKKAEEAIQAGRKVSFEYELIVDGKVIDTTENRGAFIYTHGEGQIIPGLEKKLEGLQVGDRRKIKVPPEEAYGQINPRAFHEIPRDKFPPDMPFAIGGDVSLKTKDGRTVVAKVAEVKEDNIVVDLNHPLAGKELIFNIKIVSIK